MRDFPICLAASLLFAVGGIALAEGQTALPAPPLPRSAVPAAAIATGRQVRWGDGASVLAHGADSTGRSDSTAAIQAALDAHPYAALTFPAQVDGVPGV